MQSVERVYYNHSEAALEDELTRTLSSKLEAEITHDIDGKQLIFTFHPYLNQAEGLFHKINVYDPVPEFVIWECDIPMGLATDLERLGKFKMKRVITNAVRRIYESVNPEYYHTSGIHGKVKWRFGEDE